MPTKIVTPLSERKLLTLTVLFSTTKEKSSLMAAQLQLQPNPNMATNHHHIQGQPSGGSRASTSSPPDIRSSTTSTLISPPVTLINAYHYSLLISDNAADGLRTHIEEGSDFSDLVWESDDSSILHLAASTGQLDLIDVIMQSNPALLHHSNSKDDLPIHAAAKACQFEAVKKLVCWAENSPEISMLERPNNDMNTALHIALENQLEEMAMFLFQKRQQTFYQLNEQEFSPLYLAIKAEFWELVKAMLSDDIVDRFPDAINQLKEGKSVVHAAIIARKKDILEMIVRGYNDLLYEKKDEMGRRPLSYAAYIGFLDGVQYIIQNHKNEAYKIDENGSFPIHLACSGGNIKIVKEFFSQSLPKTMKLMLNKKGQNILHVAAASGKPEAVRYILQQPELEMMINMKDEDGNTPLHLASMGKHPKVVYDFTWDERVKLSLQNKEGLTALDIAENYGDEIPSFEERLTWLSLRYAGVPRAPQLHYLNTDKNESDMANSSPNNSHLLVNNYNNIPTTFMVLEPQGNLKTNLPIKKRKSKYKERINTLVLVATLVATVTFASAFSVPGGYNNNKPDEGMATLAHKGAFQVFVISNTIAMYSAILAAVTLIWAYLDDLRLVLLSLEFAVPLLGIALAMMSVAFMAGLYVVLHTVVFWLGLVVLVMGVAFLGALLVFFIPLYSPRYIKNKILRIIFHVPFTLMLLACEKGKSGKQY